MHFLIFQHISIEHPGIFRDFMTQDKITWDTVELDDGDDIPNFANYDALIIMGGPMDIWEEDKHPWLKSEKIAIHQAIVEIDLPCLGFCLGHQLMAEALGGKVSKMSQPEVGILDIELTADGQKSQLFAGLQNKIKTLQWHGAEVTQAPPQSLVLAQSPVSNIQALQYSEYAFSMQYHIELIDSTVSDWAQVPEYAQSLEETLGAGALQKLDAKTQQYMSSFNHSARLLYNNFIAQLNQPR